MHPKEYERYISMREQNGVREPQNVAKFGQNDFNRIVLDFMIKGMHPPTLLTDSSFETLLNGLRLIFS